MKENFKMNSRIILFDGECNLCNRWVRFIIKKERKVFFQFAALQSEVGQNLLKKFNLYRKSFNTFYLIENNQCFSQSTAFLKVIDKLKWPWPVLYLCILIPKFIRDFIYDGVAKYRIQWFGKVVEKNYCQIETGNPELKTRFL